MDLTVFGVGVIIGAGIFTLTGGAQANAGPGRVGQGEGEPAHDYSR